MFVKFTNTPQEGTLFSPHALRGILFNPHAVTGTLYSARALRVLCSVPP
jgi:hypothetical protein